jgi:hypothetical protein
MTYPATAAPATAPARRPEPDTIGVTHDTVIGTASSAGITLAVPRETGTTRHSRLA